MGVEEGAVEPVAGSIAYMAPECFGVLSMSPEPAVDVWALGCVLVEIFGGAPPHSECNDAAQVIKKMLPEPFPEPDVPSHCDLAGGCEDQHNDNALQELFGQCLAREPQNRPCAADVLDELKAIADFRGITVD